MISWQDRLSRVACREAGDLTSRDMVLHLAAALSHGVQQSRPGKAQAASRRSTAGGASIAEVCRGMHQARQYMQPTARRPRAKEEVEGVPSRALHATGSKKAQHNMRV